MILGTNYAISCGGGIVIVALPTFSDGIAPCFEVARLFVLARIENGIIASKKIIECGGCEGFGRVQLLKQKLVDVLICNGIKGFYRDILQAGGIAVISDISADADAALRKFISGQLSPEAEIEETDGEAVDIPLDDLVCWTKELFAAHGYRVFSGQDRAQFPVDLVAEIDCPVCRKPIRVAICCGAHLYRADREIQMLHLVTVSDYHACVYVSMPRLNIRKYCREYGVELIDPDSPVACEDKNVAGKIPLLKSVVRGHEAASGA